MATLFNTFFVYVELENGRYDSSGLWVSGNATARKVKGSVQEGSSKEILSLQSGARNSGSLEVYSSEKLKSETRGGNEGGFVFYNGGVFRLENEQVYPYLFKHWKYTANRLLENEIQPEVKRAFDDFK